MSDVAFRLATIDDLPAIVALLADDESGGLREDASLPLDPRYLAAFDAIDADPNTELIVGERAGAVMATLQLSYLPGLAFRGGWRGQIESVRIASALRNRGLGAELIHWAVARCQARGCFMVQLTSTSTRVAAHRFYERLGWAKSHHGFKLRL